MPLNFFITGLPKSGKTTLLRKIVAELKSHGLRVGGFVSPEEKMHGTRTGFYVQDLDSGEIGLLADVNADGPKVSKYGVDIKSFENVVLSGMRNFEKYDVIVIDEIGRMELKSQKFSDALDSVLESTTPLIASLHSDYVDRYAGQGEVIFLEENNREAAYRELVDRVNAIGKKPKKAPKKPVAKPPKKAAPARKATPKKAVKAQKPAKKPKKERPIKEAGKMAKKPKKEKKKKTEEKEGKKSLVNHFKDLLGF
jgi:nucleoside-triphosphatase